MNVGRKYFTTGKAATLAVPFETSTHLTQVGQPSLLSLFQPRVVPSEFCG